MSIEVSLTKKLYDAMASNQQRADNSKLARLLNVLFTNDNSILNKDDKWMLFRFATTMQLPAVQEVSFKVIGENMVVFDCGTDINVDINKLLNDELARRYETKFMDSGLLSKLINIRTLTSMENLLKFGLDAKAPTLDNIIKNAREVAAKLKERPVGVSAEVWERFMTEKEAEEEVAQPPQPTSAEPPAVESTNTEPQQQQQPLPEIKIKPPPKKRAAKTAAKPDEKMDVAVPETTTLKRKLEDDRETVEDALKHCIAEYGSGEKVCLHNHNCVYRAVKDCTKETYIQNAKKHTMFKTCSGEKLKHLEEVAAGKTICDACTHYFSCVKFDDKTFQEAITTTINEIKVLRDKKKPTKSAEETSEPSEADVKAIVAAAIASAAVESAAVEDEKPPVAKKQKTVSFPLVAAKPKRVVVNVENREHIVGRFTDLKLYVNDENQLIDGMGKFKRPNGEDSDVAFSVSYHSSLKPTQDKAQGGILILADPYMHDSLRRAVDDTGARVKIPIEYKVPDKKDDETNASDDDDSNNGDSSNDDDNSEEKEEEDDDDYDKVSKTSDTKTTTTTTSSAPSQQDSMEVSETSTQLTLTEVIAVVEPVITIEAVAVVEPVAAPIATLIAAPIAAPVAVVPDAWFEVRKKALDQREAEFNLAQKKATATVNELRAILKQQQDDLEAKNANLSSSNQRLEKVRLEQYEIIKCKNAEINDIRGRLDRSVVEADALHEQIAVLLQSQEHAGKTKTDAETWKARAQELQKTRSTLESRLKEVTGEIDVLNQTLSSTKQELVEVTRKWKRLEEDKAIADDSMRRLQEGYNMMSAENVKLKAAGKSADQSDIVNRIRATVAETLREIQQAAPATPSTAATPDNNLFLVFADQIFSSLVDQTRDEITSSMSTIYEAINEITCLTSTYHDHTELVNLKSILETKYDMMKNRVNAVSSLHGAFKRTLSGDIKDNNNNNNNVALVQELVSFYPNN